MPTFSPDYSLVKSRNNLRDITKITLRKEIRYKRSNSLPYDGMTRFKRQEFTTLAKCTQAIHHVRFVG